jgi:predicted nucleic acid-binding Zn ribbon protein
MSQTPREEAQIALKQAQRAAKRGDAREAERWSKTAERLAAAAEKLASLPAPEIENPEALREEFLARIRRLRDVNADLMAWQQEDAIYQALKSQAEAHNIPPPAPIRPCPGGEAYLMRIASGEL